MANIEALRQLRRVVKAAPAERFHMETWFSWSHCETAACAAGWASKDDWFKAEGRDWCLAVVDHDWLEIEKASSETLFAMGRPFELTAALDANPHAVTKAMVIRNIDLLIAGKKPRSYMAMIKEAAARKRAPRAISKATSPRRSR